MKQIIALLIIATMSFAFKMDDAQDSKAKKILKDLSDKTKSYKTISLKFKYEMKGRINDKTNGSAKIKGNKYIYKAGDYEVYCDGRTIWTYSKSDNSVQISNANDEDSDAIKPTDLLTIWEKGFKYKYIGEKNEGTLKLEEIKLFPSNPSESKYHTVILEIDKLKIQLKKIKIKGKDGVNILYTVNSFTTNQSISDSEFKFNSAKHPGVEEIDNR